MTSLEQAEGVTLDIKQVAKIILEHAGNNKTAAGQMLLSFLEDVDNDEETQDYNATELLQWLGY